MLKKIFQCGAALIVGTLLATTAMAGKTGSLTITPQINQPDERELGCVAVWEDARKQAFEWYREGKIDFFSTSVQQSDSGRDPDIWKYLERWDNLTGVLLLDGTHSNLLKGVAYAMMFTVEEDSDLDNTDIGAYILLYDDRGCYIGAEFAPGFDADGQGIKDADTIFELM